jgi:hypothetical protein
MVAKIPTMAGDRLLVALWLLCLLAANPAAAGTVEDFRIWGNVTAIAKLGSLDPRLDKWRWWMEGQGRFRDAGDALDQGLVRTGLGYALTDRASVWLGYAHIATFPEARTQYAGRAPHLAAGHIDGHRALRRSDQPQPPGTAFHPRDQPGGVAFSGVHPVLAAHRRRLAI